MLEVENFKAFCIFSYTNKWNLPFMHPTQIPNHLFRGKAVQILCIVLPSSCLNILILHVFTQTLTPTELSLFYINGIMPALLSNVFLFLTMCVYFPNYTCLCYTCDKLSIMLRMIYVLPSTIFLVPYEVGTNMRPFFPGEFGTLFRNLWSPSPC